MFLQMPVFFGLFAALRTAFELRHAPFALWIEDLAKPDAMLEHQLQHAPAADRHDRALQPAADR
jgi:membrane protein insertase Oxa1/YidC/SpoIIIJ